jgi:DNA-binding NtrC family response regulator
LEEAIAEFERVYLKNALDSAQGKRVEVAKLLRISRKTLWEKLKQHKLSDE